MFTGVALAPLQIIYLFPLCKRNIHVAASEPDFKRNSGLIVSLVHTVYCVHNARRQTDRQTEWGYADSVCFLTMRVREMYSSRTPDFYLKRITWEFRRPSREKLRGSNISTLVPNPAGLLCKTKRHVRRAGRSSGGAAAVMVGPSKAASWSDLHLKPTVGGSNADQTAAVAGGHPGPGTLASRAHWL